MEGVSLLCTRRFHSSQEWELLILGTFPFLTVWSSEWHIYLEFIMQNNRAYNQLLSSVRNQQFVEGVGIIVKYNSQLSTLPESKDYVQITKKTCCSCWNVVIIAVVHVQRSILYLHGVITRWLHFNKSYDEKIEDIIHSHKKDDYVMEENNTFAKVADIENERDGINNYEEDLGMRQEH